MKKELISLIIIFLTIHILCGQDELEAIETWDMQEDIILRCVNNNRSGSDLNNDGYDDYILEEGDRFYFFMGNEELNNTYDFALQGSYGSWCVSWGGDLNGDGYKDIVYSRAIEWGDPGDVYICLGGDEIDMEPELILQGEDYVPDPFALNYHGYNGGYDFNGDGHDDLLTCGDGPSYFWNGLIQIFYGGEEFDTEPDFQIQGNSCDLFGSYRAIGDINGDGIDDLICSRTGNEENSVTFEIYIGGTNFDVISDYTINELWYGIFQCYASDINSDNIDEFLIMGSLDDITGTIGYYYIDPLEELVYTQIDPPVFGYWKYSDINGDSFKDIVSWNFNQNLLVIYYGGGGLEEYDVSLPIETITVIGQDYFCCNLGDLNGDGYEEILINNAENGELGNNATIYGLLNNDLDKCIIDNVYFDLTNYPNPFNPETTINFKLPDDTVNPMIEIFNVKGRLIRELKIDYGRCNTKDGRQNIVWDGTDNHRNRVSSGIYLYRLIDDGKVLASQKMILLK